VEKALPDLLSKYKVYHQTGDLDFGRLSAVKRRLPRKLSLNYFISPRIDPLKISEIYRNSDIVVSRAGANTVSEIILIKRPAILIPLPISYLDEQTKNAEVAESFGLARIIFQKDLTAERLITEVSDIFARRASILKKVERNVSPDSKASKRLVGILEKYV